MRARESSREADICDSRALYSFLNRGARALLRSAHSRVTAGLRALGGTLPWACRIHCIADLQIKRMNPVVALKMRAATRSKRGCARAACGDRRAV